MVRKKKKKIESYLHSGYVGVGVVICITYASLVHWTLSKVMIGSGNRVTATYRGRIIKSDKPENTGINFAQRAADIFTIYTS